MINVSSEVGTLKRLMIHSPDSGLGKVVPSKAQDWLFEDIIHLETMRREEYDHYVKLLLYFLDEDKVKGKSAGFRIITYSVEETETECVIYLVKIYTASLNYILNEY